MQKNSAFLWRPFVQWKTKETFCFTKCYQPYNYSNLLLLLRWRKWLRRCTGLMWICFIVTPVRNKVSRFFFFLFFYLFLCLFQKPKHLFKENRQSKLLRRSKRKSTETITERCFSCQNKSVCQKLAWSCKKWKSAKKAIYALFARRPSILLGIFHCVFHYTATKLVTMGSLVSNEVIISIYGNGSQS